MLPFPLVYHDGYDLHFGDHVFPTQKYKLVRRKMLDDFVAGPEDFLTPEPASREDLLLVHTAEWVRKLETGTLTYHDILKLEVPYSRKMVEAFWLAAGGTLLAASQALEKRVAVNLGGGFHHAFPGHGEGFCAIHDVAVAIRVLQSTGRIRTVLVVDLDVHQGNGTAAIFAGDSRVMTISFHQRDLYPAVKPPSTIDINLEPGTRDREYLEKLSSVFGLAVRGFRPDLVMYVAGSDPYFDDQLGGLSLTKEGLRARDRIVFEQSMGAGVPVAVTFAGGYARELRDTVELHGNTILAARDVLTGR